MYQFVYQFVADVCHSQFEYWLNAADPVRYASICGAGVQQWSYSDLSAVERGSNALFGVRRQVLCERESCVQSQHILYIGTI